LVSTSECSGDGWRDIRVYYWQKDEITHDIRAFHARMSSACKSTDSLLAVGRGYDCDHLTKRICTMNRRQLGTTGLVWGLGVIATSGTSYSQENQMTRIIEIVNFKLVGSANANDFQAAVLPTVAFLKAQRGFVARRLSKDETGQYTDHVEWETLADAQAAMTASMTQPSLMPFLQMIDPSTMRLQHNEVILSVG
jgi:hypothetical protein